MAAVDPYSPCPCGSLEKYKWCCHKAEEPALRVERLIRGEQYDQALKAVEEGLRKAKGAFWLLMQKAFLHERRDEPRQAAEAIDAILKNKPDHLGALAQRVELTLIAEGPRAAAAELQSALSAVKPEDRPIFGAVFRMVGAMLVRAEAIPAAIAHLEVAAAHEPEDAPIARQALRSIMTDPGILPWVKNPYDLASTPEGLPDDARSRFDDALQAADEALWARAASGFETLSADGIPGADLNLGLCRLWLGDEEAAVAALRRHSRAIGPTPEAVDLEALCQLIEPIGDDDLVEHVRLTWPIADRNALLAALRDAEQQKRTVVSEGQGILDPDDPEATEVDIFSMLDRPRPAARPGLSPADMPRVSGRILVARDSVLLDGFDVGKQFDELRERFTELAGPGIPPAHPRTTVLEKVPRVSLALRTEWILPEGQDPEETRRIRREEQIRVIREVWPEQPLTALGGRSPRQAIRDGDAEIPLRAAFCQFDYGPSRLDIELDALRAELGIPPEPTPDPVSVDIEAEHLARLPRIPAEHLDDERLWALYVRSRGTGQHLALRRSAIALSSRPNFLEGRSAAERYTVFGDLANLSASAGNTAEALEWVERGRRDEPASHRNANAPRWDFLALRIRARSEEPEQWVPELAVVLERYREDRSASQTVMTNLLDMGLMRMVPHPERPDQAMLDSRPLMAVLSRYGPRITTAAGELGVSASRPSIWTPGASAGGSSGAGVWTPGAPAGGSEQGGERKIILPGQ
ncbi:hypothetical protein [Tautonia sociabilis]|uniref:Tetratricopeptide repeat protein n=1 Tax=Tautonia sociabilis TaxID=2080755 RepID=A0A432MG35_9BACT|nr:hypothetical protein [Tautonia sociabilis]RUL85540.1 hypothetical protein TsocGM_18345 [Tautonia sociabilis]